MRKLIVLTFVTLDGIMQAPGGPTEISSGGFSHGGSWRSYFDEFLAILWASKWINHLIFY